jgi:hypothetical protein
MIRNGLIALILATGVCCAPLFAQDSPEHEPADLKVELRSATGSNRFQLGEVIPLEVLMSSSTPNRYLEPCKMFWESCFGFPQCRFVTEWSFDVNPSTGWTDIGWHGCSAMSGPTTEIASADLTAEPKTYPYTLTNRFRFDAPGKYTVRLSLTIGLDDATNQIGRSPDSKAKSNSVRKTAEVVLEITPAGSAWKGTVIEKGVEAWSAGAIAGPPPHTEPPSAEYLKYQKDTEALCNLGTPEAAVALVGLLSRGVDVTHCLNINSNQEVAEAEMRRLLVDPNVGVRPVFFNAYANLLSQEERKAGQNSSLTIQAVNEERATLFAALPKKSPEAMIPSLETVLRCPFCGYSVMEGSIYGLHDPYADAVIAMAAANFDRLSGELQATLLDTDWDHVRSPLMLPVVRRKAEAGNGQALLRWLELDPAPATAFMREEVVRAAPRFSSLYLRLPDESLPGQEQQIAANFVALKAPEELERAATLLHRYTTRATLPIVLPFIDQHLAEWPCELQIPVLAYLLKDSPDEARPRVEQIVRKVSPGYCPRGEFFPNLGHVEASPVLDTLAVRQVEDGTPLAGDAAAYLERYASAAMKPVVWEQLSRWHRKYAESGAELRMSSQKSTEDDMQLYNLDSRMLRAYVNAQGWTLSPDDEDRLAKLLGDQESKGLSCAFNCSSRVSVGPAPGNYYIFGHYNDPVYPEQSRVDYLTPTEPFHYSLNQYQCADLKTLEQKLLQFPAGSTFSVAHTGSILDGWGDWASISSFLTSHGYSFRNQVLGSER